MCYVEFGQHQVGKVDVDFLSGPKPTGTFHGASEAIVAENQTEIAELRGRVAVLERLATDEDARVAREIDKLRGSGKPEARS